MNKLCNLCPRKCNANRTNIKGFCGCGRLIHISKVMLHHWEEPIISGQESSKGSGTIFFSGCNLKCVYCQNELISRSENGTEYKTKQFLNLIKELEKMGALNINLVTPTHYVEEIIKALKIYKPKIPVVYNTSGYEDPQVIKKLNNLIDIYLVDYKYCDNDISFKYSRAIDYNINCVNSINEMLKQCPKNIYKIENDVELLTKGVIIRHLVLPNNVDNSKKVLDSIKKEFGTDVLLSIMCQYVPCGDLKNFQEINRKLKPIEYKAVITYAQRLGFKDFFIQEFDSASKSYIPDFKL